MKNDRDKILARLSSILGKLNVGESVSVSELAEEYGVSPLGGFLSFHPLLILDNSVGLNDKSRSIGSPNEPRIDSNSSRVKYSNSHSKP